MSDHNPTSAGALGETAPQMSLPRCQYCGTDPIPVVPAFINISGAKAVVFHCAVCRATFGVQLMTVSGRPAQTDSRIMVPQ